MRSLSAVVSTTPYCRSPRRLLNGRVTCSSEWRRGGGTAPPASWTLTAAIAEHHGAIVLHYDADFEHIAATTGQPHLWVVPRGSVC